MERPSHIQFANRHFSHRLPLIGMALSFQAAALWLFIHGFSHYRFVDIPPDITVSAIPDKPDTPLPPPPDPTLATHLQSTAVIPIFDTAPGDRPPIHVDPRPLTDDRQIATLVLPDRAPVGIISSHTTPPYPPIARRLGFEGKVTLRLTVSTEGRVSQAEVVTSSGRDDLDQTAEQWIMAHWIYKPALVNGTPAASKALAIVTFSLTNDR